MLKNLSLAIFFLMATCETTVIEQTNEDVFGQLPTDQKSFCCPETNLFITDPVNHKYEKTYDGIGTWETGIIGATYDQYKHE